MTLGDTATPFPHLFPALALALFLVARAAVLLVHCAGDVLLPPPEGWSLECRWSVKFSVFYLFPFSVFSVVFFLPFNNNNSSLL